MKNYKKLVIACATTLAILLVAGENPILFLLGGIGYLVMFYYTFKIMVTQKV